MDGPTSNPAPVVITASWNVIQTNVRGISVYFGNSPAAVLGILSSSPTSSEISVLPPSGLPPGIVQGNVTGEGDMFSTFKFEFFDPPEIIKMQPQTASLEGIVPPCSACLRNDNGRTASLWLKGFPRVEEVSQLQVTFGDTSCDGSVCYVASIDTLFDPTSASDLLYITVTVPPAQEAGPVDVTVAYVGHQGPLPGEEPTVDYQRATKAANGIFSYVSFAPEVILVQYCKVCHEGPTCLVAGLCGDASGPHPGNEEYVGVISMEGGGRTTITIDHFGRRILGDEVVVRLGTSGAQVVRVTSATTERTVLEVTSLAMDKTGVLDCLVRIEEEEMHFKVLVMDDSVSVECTA